jgi:hypothetical protein
VCADGSSRKSHRPAEDKPARRVDDVLMHGSTRPARERIITTEVRKLEMRQARERSRRAAADQDLLRLTAGPAAPR